jgi:uncharacterized membrane protein YcaP (DUF421 family)
MDLKEILLTVCRGAIAYLMLLTVTRILGRKAIGQMTFFDYTVAITFGSITANLGIGSNKSPLNAALVLLTFGALYLLTTVLVVKSFRMRKLISSEPVVVIAEGELVKTNMKRTHMTIGLLNKMLRDKDVFNIMDVEYAIYEYNGQLSVLLKSSKQPTTPKDMNLPAPYQGLTAELILDGRVMSENLRAAGKDQEWLRDELRKMGVDDPARVFFAAMDTAGSLYVSMGDTGPERHGRYGIE